MGAEVRASLSNTPRVDKKCGSNVTQYQALINDWIEFTCDPPRLAQYVRIEIPRQTALILCEVRIWPCDLHPAALNLTEKRSYQSSTSGNSIASLALDNLPSEPYCSETVNEMNPWWKLDFETSQCVEAIRVWPTVHGAALQRASLRAGLSDNHTSNVECKTSQPQPSPNDFTEFTCHPPVLARYVSVDIPGMASLGLCEVTVAACDFNQKVNSVDFTVVVNPALIGPTGDNDSVIAVYREPDDFASNVSFGRQVTTGLPSGSGEIVDSSLGCTVRLLRLPEEGGLDRTGVFYAEATKNDVITRIQSVVLPKDGNTQTT
ncbi:uncharacterized protein LOC110990760 [Acanthaster planci]|uniref:Uncharacterized protein LOC110990760 n=1 Tax=Acanthaster planci TaxID=133434 RepID=A0A8B8A1D0_ACAPL|nr:uncharacterized protein LOC110990760 [Acanthaster planci]